jgi:hypothetical protein
MPSPKHTKNWILTTSQDYVPSGRLAPSTLADRSKECRLDGQAVFNNTEPLRDYIECLRGFSARREESLKQKLSAAEQNDLNATPEWREVARQIAEPDIRQPADHQKLYKTRSCLREDAIQRSHSVASSDDL